MWKELLAKAILFLIFYVLPDSFCEPRKGRRGWYRTPIPFNLDSVVLESRDYVELIVRHQVPATPSDIVIRNMSDGVWSANHPDRNGDFLCYKKDMGCHWIRQFHKIDVMLFWDYQDVIFIYGVSIDYRKAEFVFINQGSLILETKNAFRFLSHMMDGKRVLIRIWRTFGKFICI